MKISEMMEQMPVKLLTAKLEKDNDITTAYCCDLLSRVMSKAEQDCVWMTVLTHLNIIAVAQLADIGCILIPESIPVPRETIDKAEEEGINILSTELTSYEVSWRLHALLL